MEKLAVMVYATYTPIMAAVWLISSSIDFGPGYSRWQVGAICSIFFLIGAALSIYLALVLYVLTSSSPAVDEQGEDDKGVSKN